MLAQLVGAVVGALLVVASFGTGSVDTSATGAVSFGDGVGYPQAVLAEALATFLLLLTIFALAVDTRAPAGWAGLMIGLSVTCLVLVFGPLTGAAVNPARAWPRLSPMRPSPTIPNVIVRLPSSLRRSWQEAALTRGGS